MCKNWPIRCAQRDFVRSLGNVYHAMIRQRDHEINKTRADFDLSWVHCNICCEEFLGHNVVKRDEAQSAADGIVIISRDLTFSMFDCGHIYCGNCISTKINSLESPCAFCDGPRSSIKLIGRLSGQLIDTHLFIRTDHINTLINNLCLRQFHLKQLLEHYKSKSNTQKHLLEQAKMELERMKRSNVPSNTDAAELTFHSELMPRENSIRIPLSKQTSNFPSTPISKHSKLSSSIKTPRDRGSISRISMTPSCLVDKRKEQARLKAVSELDQLKQQLRSSISNLSSARERTIPFQFSSANPFKAPSNAVSSDASSTPGFVNFVNKR